MALHSSTLAWKIPWMEEPGRLQSMGLLGVGHDWATSLSLFTFMCWRRKWQPTPVFLPGESQGRGSLVGYRLWGRRVGHDWSDLAAAAATVPIERISYSSATCFTPSFLLFGKHVKHTFCNSWEFSFLYIFARLTPLLHSGLCSHITYSDLPDHPF